MPQEKEIGRGSHGNCCYQADNNRRGPRPCVRLQLTVEMYTSSRGLRIWCNRNRNRVYIPEWLLKDLDIAVDAFFSGVA